MRKRMAVCLVFVAVLAGVASPALARIKLAALPERQRVEIQLDNGRYTLVEEERGVPLLKSTPRRGNNQIDFSWSNTQIDKNSIQFRPITILDGGKYRPIKKLQDGGEEISVINVAYPPGENALVWEVYAAESCAVKVRVSYLINNLTRTFSYRALADNEEKTLVLRNFIELHNFSGEEFGTAGVWAGFGEKFLKPVGQEEELKMLMHRFENVPIEKLFTYDWYTNGPLNPAKPLSSKVLMYYKLSNDEKHAMGLFPLQPGKVRIFIKDPRGSQAFLGEDWAKLTPLDDEMKLYLGEARDIVCKRIIESNQRHHVRGNLYNQEIVIKYEIENFKDKPCTFQILEQINRVADQYFGRRQGDVEWVLGDKTSKELRIKSEDGVTPVLMIELPARPKDKNKKVEKKTVRFHFTIKNLW